MAAIFDGAEIRRNWQVYREPGEVAEVRILNAGKWLGTVSGYFDNEEDFTKIVSELAADPDHPVPAIYFTINPVSPDLLARAANRTIAKAKNTTSDADIVALHWLPGDLDSKRPAGISSTDEEHDAAIAKAYEVRGRLIELGWPENAFVLADSGNGAHLDTKIDLQNVPEDVALVRRCLEAMDFLFSDEAIHVDTTSQNPARIWKVRGTMARKGDSIQERPHRLSRFLEVPETMETVTREQLEALAAMLPEPEKISQPSQSTGGPAFDPVEYCQAHNLPVHHSKTWADPSGTKCTVAVLEQCIFNPEHHLSAVIIGWPNGARSYRCRHNSCLNKRWRDAKAILEPGTDSFDGIPTMPPLTRARADAIEAETGVHIFNAVDDPSQNEISEEEFNAFKLDSGPKLTCNLPGDNFISRFMQYGSEISDAYRDYWFAGAIFALAVATDKKLKFELGQDTIYTNVYIYIAGGSTLARKTTALKKSVRMLEESMGGRLGISKVPNEFSPEAFIEHMDQFNHAPWIRDEAAGVLSLMRKDYMRGFKDTLMQLYDCTPITRMLRTSQRKAEKTRFNIADPFLNVFFASTDAALGANTEANDALSGFLARFMFFYPQGEKDCYMPLRKGTARHSELEEIAREQLRRIVELMDSMPDCVDMDYTPDAQAYYEEWQERREKELARLKDGFSSQIFGRLMPAVVKLAMLFEVGSPGFDPTTPIGLASFQEASRLADEYFLPMSRAVYDLVGQTEEKNVIDKIVAYLKRNGGRATQRETARAIKIKSKELAEYLSTMLEYGMIDRREKDNGGKGRNQVYLFLREVNGTKVSKVSKVSNVTNVPDKDCVMDSQGTLVTLEPLVTKETLEPIKRESNPEIDRIRAGHQKHVARRRTCCLCGRSFPYDLTPYFNKGQSGYICVTCHMEGPPAEPVKADSQTKLEASG